MALEKHYSLSAAARLIGVDRTTLRDWLRQIGIVIPYVRRGSKALLRERDIERVLERRRDARYALKRS